MSPASQIDVYLEIGKSKTFAGAIEWPGWCRSGRDEPAALNALLAYATRYARAIENTKLGFKPPADLIELAVLERLEGNVTTDFGTPAVAPSADAKPVTSDDLKKFKTILKASWDTFDSIAKAAEGKELRKGPRGGGRDLDEIILHVKGGDEAYLSRLGWSLKLDKGSGALPDLGMIRQEMLKALEASVRGELPTQGPRGGTIWGPRYFVRRAAWHALDHAWEIEDRIVEG